MLLALGVAACGPAPAPALRTGTYPGANADWSAREARPQTSARGLTRRLGEVTILEGDAELVSGAPGQYGLRFDETRNDLAAVAGRFAREVRDTPGELVLFTTFEELGGGGAAYYVPFANEVLGLGLARFDQRAEFGVTALDGIANLKRLDDHLEGQLHALLAHEISHGKLAYLSVEVEGSTRSPPLLGRQNAHWHAALSTEGSVLGGHGLVETSAGQFAVNRRETSLSSLDLYGLGLFRADEVRDFFFVDDARTEEGFAIPAEARLEVGARLRGTRIDLGIGDVIRAAGPRDPPAALGDLQLYFLLLTEPGEAATSSRAEAIADRIDRLRVSFEGTWAEMTEGRGQICSRVGGCAPPAVDAGPGGEEMPEGGCSCGAQRAPEHLGAGRGAFAGSPFVPALLCLLLGAGALVRRPPGTTRRLRGRSCDRLPSRAPRPCRAVPRPRR